jgi:hypothetical protein
MELEKFIALLGGGGVFTKVEGEEGFRYRVVDWSIILKRIPNKHSSEPFPIRQQLPYAFMV